MFKLLQQGIIRLEAYRRKRTLILSGNCCKVMAFLIVTANNSHFLYCSVVENSTLQCGVSGSNQFERSMIFLYIHRRTPFLGVSVLFFSVERSSTICCFGDSNLTRNILHTVANFVVFLRHDKRQEQKTA